MTRFFALCFCLSPALLSAQQSPAPALSGIQGAFFAASVADLDASVAWYTQKLGLTQITRWPKQGMMQGAVLRGGGLEVELIAHDDATAPRDPMDMDARVLTRGIIKAGFIVADLDATLATLRARGVPIAIGPFPPRRDQRANAIIRDNSGNLIQLFGDFAR
jgi:catechol 2,3-dioxygenase-like lactoylglutathione lyase family enzyme